MSTITCSHLDFSYGAAEVFSDLSLIIDAGWKTGLVGRNGRGKTTFLRLLTGELRPAAGQLNCPIDTRFFPGPVTPDQTTLKVARSLIAPFDTWQVEMERLLQSNDADATDLYNDLLAAFQDARGYEIDGLIEKEFEKIGLPFALLGRPFDSLSHGQQTRVQIVSLFLAPNSYALIDEPTNHLDIPGRRQLADYLNHQSGFLLVSHDRALLDGCTDHIVSINKADVRVNNGNWSSWHRAMQNELLSETRSRQRLESEISQLSVAAQGRRQGADKKESEKYGDSHADTGFIGHKAAKQMKRALHAERRIEKQLEEKQSLLGNQEKQRQLIIASEGTRDKLLLTINNLKISLGGNDIIDELSLSVSGGERIALVGANGSGKSSVLNAIEGHIEYQGTIDLRCRQISRSWQHPIWSAGMLRDHLNEAGLDETRFRQFLGTLDVRGEIFEQPLEAFRDRKSVV